MVKPQIMILICFLMLPLVHGATFLSGDDALSNLTGNLELVDGTSVYWDNVYAVSQTLLLSHQLQGDFFGIGKNVVIDSPVDGDIFVLGQTVTINAPVTGDLRVIATSVVINAPIDGEVLALSEQMTVTRDGRIGRELVASSSKLVVDGRIEEGMRASATNFELDAPIGASVFINAETISLGKNALIGGDLIYSSPIELNDPSFVSGKVNWLPPKKPDMMSQVLDKGKEFASAYISFLIIALLLLYLPFGGSTKPADLERKTILPAAGIGLLMLCATPVIGVILFITGIGIPLALILAGIYILFWYMAKFPISLYIGSYILSGKSKYHQMAVGWLVYLMAIYLPIIGWIFYVAGLIIGIGMIARWIWSNRTVPDKKLNRKKKIN